MPWVDSVDVHHLMGYGLQISQVIAKTTPDLASCAQRTQAPVWDKVLKTHAQKAH